MSQVEYDVDDKDDKDDDEQDEQYVAIEEDDESGDKEDDGDDKEGSEDEEEGEEQRLGGGRDEEGEEDKKARRREENKTRRARQKEARERTDRELKFLRTRNEDLERRFSKMEVDVDARVTGSEVANVDAGINKAKSDLALANQVISQAVEQQKGDDLAEALTHRDTIRDNLRDLEQAREYLQQEDTRRSTEQPRMDPRHEAFANSFMMDHDWWDPRGVDQDSRNVLRIDNVLAQEGYDPRTKEFWDELRGRVQKELPHRFDAGSDDNDDDADTGNGKPKGGKRRSKGPAFRTGGHERPLKKGEVFISKERREAMEEAGVWADPVLRNKYLASYAKYDAQEQEGA